VVKSFELKQFFALLKHEFTAEWRQRNALGGILLYVISTVFVAYLTFKRVEPLTWIALYWIIMLFASVNAVAKSFIQHAPGKMLYYYLVADPLALLAAKLVYNIVLLWTIQLMAFGAMSLLVGQPVQDPLMFLISGGLAAVGFAASGTLVSAISHKATNQSTLMAILSFPVLLPVLTLVIKLSKNALDGLDRSVSYNELLSLLAVDALVAGVALLLFPYLWKE
jgi:heme exporter protein B